MPRTNARVGATRARAILHLYADHGAATAEIATACSIGIESVRAVLRGQTYRRVSRGLPLPSTVTAEALDALLDRRLELIAAHRRYGERRRARSTGGAS